MDHVFSSFGGTHRQFTRATMDVAGVLSAHGMLPTGPSGFTATKYESTKVREGRAMHLASVTNAKRKGQSGIA